MPDWSALQQSGVLTLLGIVLGWLLSSISSTLRFRNDRKADLSKAVARTLPELSKMENLKGVLEGFKETSQSWTEYERTRYALWQRHGNFFESKDGADWDQLIDGVAKHKPILAIRIRNVAHLAGKLGQNDLSRTSRSSSDAYLKLLSALEVTHEGLIRETEKVVRKLSWSAGIRTGLGVEWHMRNRGGGPATRQKNAEFIQRFHLDVSEDLTTKA